MAQSELKTASVLAFERKLDPSDALFSAGRWDDRQQGAQWPGIGVREKSVRGTISNRHPGKLDAKIESPNPQTVDVATLPSEADTLRIRFTLRVLSGAGTPSACNNADYQRKLQETVAGYVQSNGFGELARRYAYNLANGRFLWRNRMGAEQIEVRVHQLKQGEQVQTWVFNARDFDMRSFDAQGNEDVGALAGVIGQGLNNAHYVLLEVIAYARMGDGQEVFPSQEMILLERDKNDKSKTLYAIGGVAGMHSQKVGNALRTIDTWYQDDEGLGPIAVEPYGSVTSRGKAYRQPKQKMDFYTLLDQWVLRDKKPAEDQQHYVMATLIRGGVFGEAAEKG